MKISQKEKELLNRAWNKPIFHYFQRAFIEAYKNKFLADENPTLMAYIN